MNSLDSTFWLNRRVLVTGHTGFKGSYLCYWLAELGADPVGFALEPSSSAPLYRALSIGRKLEPNIGDIRNFDHLEDVVASTRPEIIFHLAADAIVLDSLRDPVGTIATNVTGTANLLQAARRAPDLRAIVVVTSDKCYAPSPSPRREADMLGGDDPYAASKACAEFVAQAFRHCYFPPMDGVGLATARAGNVIGGGDFAPHRLVPDLVRGAQSGEPVRIRHASAVRPWQHVLDALAGYLRLAECLSQEPERFAKAWNFGPLPEEEWPVWRVADTVCKALGGRWINDPPPESVESQVLRLDATAASRTLSWRPQLDTATALNWTLDGYRRMAKEGGEQWLAEQLAAYEGRDSDPPIYAECGVDGLGVVHG